MTEKQLQKEEDELLQIMRTERKVLTTKFKANCKSGSAKYNVPTA